MSEEGQDLWLWSDGSITGTAEVWAYEQAFAQEAAKRWTRRLRRWLVSLGGGPERRGVTDGNVPTNGGSQEGPEAG